MDAHDDFTQLFTQPGETIGTSDLLRRFSGGLLGSLDEALETGEIEIRSRIPLDTAPPSESIGSNAGAMMNIQGRNNYLLGSFVALGLFLLAIPVHWFSLSNATLDNPAGLIGSLIAQDFGGRSFTIDINGLHGSLTLLIKVPIWLLLCISSFSVLVLILNTFQVTSIRRAVPVLGLAIPGIYYFIPFFLPRSQASMGVGPIMALLATILGLILALEKTERNEQARER